jgi:nucleoside-triphosphatase THEP1
MYLFAIRQINLEHLNPGFLLTLISVIYIITGMTGSVAGYLTGLKYLRTKSISDNIYEVTLESGNQLPEPAAEKGYSLILLTFNLISIAGILLLINLNYIIASAILSVFYISYCIIKYKNSLKRLGKITFWISFIIITFAAAFLWNGFSHSAFFSTDGLIIGLKMNARAIIIVIGFASLSVELKNPIIKTILYNRGFASLYQSLNLAFSALPFFLSNISVRSKKNKRMSGKTIHGILGQAESLLNKFEKDHLVKPEIIIVTGEIHQGKTSFTQKIVFDLLYQKIRIAGFVSIGIVKDGTRTGFNLAEIGSSRQVELCSDRKDDKGLKMGRFYFKQEALDFGNEILNPHNLSDKQLIVIDEIGPLEIKGLGWSEAIDKSIRSFLIPQLWVVRKNLVQKIIRKWNIGNVYIFDITEDSISEVEIHIIEILSKQGPINGNKQ